MQNPTASTAFDRTAPIARTHRVLGLPVFGGNRADCERLLSSVLSHTDAPLYLVFTPNLEMLAHAKHDGAVHALLSHADLLLPDGIGVLLLSGFRVKERIPGIETGEFLLSLAEKRGYRVYLLGGRRGIAERAAEGLRERFPRIHIVGTHHGYFERREEAEVLKEIRRAAPELLIVCTGFPRQEELLVRMRDGNALPSVRLAIGLGGSLDCWAGVARRAPRLLQALGLEWLYRVAREPKRAKRLIKSVLYLIPTPR